MKKYLIYGLAAVFAFILVYRFLIDTSLDSSDRLPADASHKPSKKNSLTDGGFQNPVNDERDSSDESFGEDLDTTASWTKKAQELLNSWAGFEDAVPLTFEEFDEYQQWSSENGMDIAELKNTDYASYSVDALYDLAQQGDIRAYEVLVHKLSEVGTPDEEFSILYRLGMIIGAPKGSLNLTIDTTNKYQAAYQEGDRETYHTYFVETAALLEHAKMRGTGITGKMINGFLTTYKFDVDIEELKLQAQQRNIEITQEINNLRRQRGWKPLENNIPRVMQKLQTANKN